MFVLSRYNLKIKNFFPTCNTFNLFVIFDFVNFKSLFIFMFFSIHFFCFYTLFLISTTLFKSLIQKRNYIKYIVPSLRWLFGRCIISYISFDPLGAWLTYFTTSNNYLSSHAFICRKWVCE